MRHLIVGLLIGLLLGASGVVLAQWGNDPKVGQGFQNYSLEQRLYRDVTVPPSHYAAPLPGVPMPYQSPC